jgi:hypothetical protein
MQAICDLHLFIDLFCERKEQVLLFFNPSSTARRSKADRRYPIVKEEAAMTTADLFFKDKSMTSLAHTRRANRSNAVPAGICALLLCVLVFGVLPAAAGVTYSLPIRNQTGLYPTEYTIYVLGYSTASKLMLLNDGTFGPFPGTKGTIPGYPVGSGGGQVSEITIEESVNLSGARIYFFVAQATAAAPSLSYSNGGASVSQPGNPPNANCPRYSFVEITQIAENHPTPTVDVQTVDGFIFPLTISLNGGGSVGQPYPTTAVTRNAIFTTYQKFMKGLGSEGAPYLDLQFTEAGGGLLNPYCYLVQTDSKNQFLNLSSSLNTVFDTALATLFSNDKLSLQGVPSGSIPADVYTVTSTASRAYPGSKFSLPALQLKGQTHGNVFNIFNPLGLAVMVNPGTKEPITGSIDNGTSLTFDRPLPAGALAAGMYVQGAGTNPKTTTIQSVVEEKNGAITGVVLNKVPGTPPPHSQYVFSKVQNLFATSGAMVLGNMGVFADSSIQFPKNADAAYVLGNLENQIAAALNRGVATLAPSSGTAGYTSNYWYKETEWYPQDQPQNIFSLFMHCGSVSATNHVFVQPNPSVKNARGLAMGQAYGFPYDESPATVPNLGNQPPVPSKYDPTPPGTTTITITLGPWD